MSRALAAERVIRDVDVVARAGLPTADFVAEALASLARAVPHAGACAAHLDPTTHLNTGAHRFGELHDHGRDREWSYFEFLADDPTALAELARRRVPAVAMDSWARLSGGHSPRMAELMRPEMGFLDELRVILRDGEEVWGGLNLVRLPEDGPFDDEDVELLTRLSSAFAIGLRTGLLATLATCDVPATGPAVIVVDANDAVKQVSDNAAQRLAELLSARLGETSGTIASLVGAARRFSGGTTDRPARCRLRGRSGQWLVLHATTLSNADGTAGDVVVTIDEARPPEILPLVVAAFDLTPRERDVALLVLHGIETREIAGRLHLSAYTVQDHLKSIFDKASVRSRRELMARIWFDQYVPHSGDDLAPTGWFLPARPEPV